jgi:nitroimidazol reductase NimA-like FMN-containing flavoprotein (pyridoxamine 5'-phosphate oxidase superfamily)
VKIVTVELPRIKEDETKKLIKEQILCRIAFKGKNYLYMAPFQYIYMKDTLYFYFTDYGRKMKFLEKDKRVCVEIEKYQPDMSEYNFVVLRGSIEIVNDAQKGSRAITKMTEDRKRKLSRNFLAANCFKKEEGLSALSPEKPLVIVRLTESVEEIGLKSPSLQ